VKSERTLELIAKLGKLISQFGNLIIELILFILDFLYKIDESNFQVFLMDTEKAYFKSVTTTIINKRNVFDKYENMQMFSYNNSLVSKNIVTIFEKNIVNELVSPSTMNKNVFELLINFAIEYAIKNSTSTYKLCRDIRKHIPTQRQTILLQENIILQKQTIQPAKINLMMHTLITCIAKALQDTVIMIPSQGL
jgi:hypothetical protein